MYNRFVGFCLCMYFTIFIAVALVEWESNQQMTRFWDIELPPDREKLTKGPQNAVGKPGWTSA